MLFGLGEKEVYRLARRWRDYMGATAFADCPSLDRRWEASPGDLGLANGRPCKSGSRVSLTTPHFWGGHLGR